MPHKWWYFIGALLIAAAAVAVWLVNKHVDQFATAIGCADTLLSKVDSPDGRYAALIFRRECGATAPDSTQVSVQPVGTSLNPEKYNPVIVVDTTPALTVRWDSANELVVAGITSQRIYRQQSVSADGINIKYEASAAAK
jgi:hypothetical protein